tara:strand:- start:4081 stop:4719 length:639 start_codon:yes stop_codon:yes gene_type:complete
MKNVDTSSEKEKEKEIVHKVNYLHRTGLYYIEDVCNTLKEVQSLSTILRPDLMIKTVFPFIDGVIQDILISVSMDDLTRNEKIQIDLFFSVATSLSRIVEHEDSLKKEAEWTLYHKVMSALIRKTDSKVSWLHNRRGHLALLASVSKAVVPYSELLSKINRPEIAVVRIINELKSLGLVQQRIVNEERAICIKAKGVRLLYEMDVSLGSHGQ